jgi:hypothetical protein
VIKFDLSDLKGTVKIDAKDIELRVRARNVDQSLSYFRTSLEEQCEKRKEGSRLLDAFLFASSSSTNLTTMDTIPWGKNGFIWTGSVWNFQDHKNSMIMDHQVTRPFSITPRPSSPRRNWDKAIIFGFCYIFNGSVDIAIRYCWKEKTKWCSLSNISPEYCPLIQAKLNHLLPENITFTEKYQICTVKLNDDLSLRCVKKQERKTETQESEEEGYAVFWAGTFFVQKMRSKINLF